MSSSSRLALCFLLFVFACGSVVAAIKTWDGSSDGNWATGGNWSGSTAPAIGDDLVFPTGVAQLVMTNNFSPNRTFGSITILGANFVIRGSPVLLTNGLHCGNATAANAIDAPITLQASQRFIVTNASASLLLRGTNLSLGANTLTLDGSGRMDISNSITGSGGVIKQGVNTVLFHGNLANTYTGTTTVNAGTLRLSRTNSIAVPGNLIVGDGAGGADADVVEVLEDEQIANTAAVTVKSSGLLDFSLFQPTDDETFDSLTLENGGHVGGPNSSSLTVTNITCTGNSMSVIDGVGYLLVMGPTPTILVSGSGAGINLDISLAIGVTDLTKTGPGWLRVTGPLLGSPDVDINSGTFQTTVGSALGTSGNAVTVASNATLFLNGGGTYSGHLLELNGAGFGGTAGALKVSGGSNIVWSGSMLLASDSTVFVADGGFSGPVTSLVITGAVDGVGALIKEGGGTLRFAGPTDNTYSGGTTIRDGYLDLSKSPGADAIPGNVLIDASEVGSSPDLHLNSANQIANGADITLNGGMFDLNTFTETIGTLNGSGSVTLGPGSTLTVSPGAGTTCVFHGGISSPGNLTKSGGGTLILTANNTFTGSTFVNAGTLQVDGTNSKSPVFLNNAGRLQGNGTVGDVTLNNSAAVVAPGASPGILTCSNLDLAGSGHGTLQFELGGTTPGVGSDQLNVRDMVKLTGLALAGSLISPSSLSNQFVIIKNDGASAVSGAFYNLPQNALVTIGGEQFRINYAGGNGNDVVLTQVSGAFRPLLAIDPISPSSLRLRWPTNNATGFGLQSNTNLQTTNWAAVSPGPVVVNGANTVTNTITGPQKFFRLSKP